MTAVHTQLPLRTHRDRMLAGLPVTERRLDAAAVPTVVLEGGDGPPVVLLHGPGESAVNWPWTIPDVATSHRVAAPELPAHGSSGTGEAPLDTDLAVAWLDDLLEGTCAEPPVVVGHVLGGASASRRGCDPDAWEKICGRSQRPATARRATAARLRVATRGAATSCGGAGAGHPAEAPDGPATSRAT